MTTTAVPQPIAVLGGGSFGTAIANLIARNGFEVTLWLRDEARAQRIASQRENADYLPGYRLDDNLKVSSNLEAAVRGAGCVFFSVPSKSMRDVARRASPYLDPGAIAISSAKGIEEDGFKLMSEVLAEELETRRIGVLSGPNLAREIAEGQITATVIASKDQSLCQTVQALMGSPRFRVYSSEDPFGVELAGALKNIYAIEAGIASALNLGQNPMSVLITRSLAEMSRFATSLGADPLTFLGLSGVGDLFVTCTSPLSRNFRVGYALGQGKSLAEAQAEVGQVAEGVKTTCIVREKATELGIYMPLASALYEVMFNNRPIEALLRDMMSSEQSTDVDFRQGKPHGK